MDDHPPCPDCSATDGSDVIDSRHEGRYRRRRRRCLKCRGRWTTYEVPAAELRRLRRESRELRGALALLERARDEISGQDAA